MDRTDQARSSTAGGRRSLSEYAYPSESGNAEITPHSRLIRNSQSPEIPVPVRLVRKHPVVSGPYYSPTTPSLISERTGTDLPDSTNRREKTGQSWTMDLTGRMKKALQQPSIYKPVASVGGGGGGSKMEGCGKTQLCGEALDVQPYYHPGQKVECTGVKIWFGSYAAATNGTVEFAWRPDDWKMWKLTVSGLDHSPDSFALGRNDVNELETCLSHQRAVFVLLPSSGFCTRTSRKLNLSADNLDIFDNKAERRAHKLICLNFGASPSASNLVGTFSRWQNHILLSRDNKVRTIDDDEANERLDAAENAKKDMTIDAARESRQFSPVREFLKDQIFFLIDCLGLGVFEKKHCMLEISLSKECFYIYACPDLASSPEVGSCVVPWADIKECRYCVEYQIAVFRLASDIARSLPETLEKLTSSANLRRDIQKSNTTEVNSVTLLRVLFGQFGDTNQKNELRHLLKLVNWPGVSVQPAASFAGSVFPSMFPKLARSSQERSTMGSSVLGSSNQSRRNGPPVKGSLKALGNKTALYAPVVEQIPENESGHSLFSVNDLGQKGRQQKRPKTNGQNHSTSLLHEGVKRTKPDSSRNITITSHPETVDIDFENNENVGASRNVPSTNGQRPRNSILGKIPGNTAPVSRVLLNEHLPDRRKKQTSDSSAPILLVTNDGKVFAFPEMKGFLDEWEDWKEARKREAAVAESVIRPKSRNSQRTFQKTTANTETASVSNASECIVVLDSDGEGDVDADEQPVKAHHSIKTVDLDLPEDCHPAFQSVPVFKEIILGNSSVMAGDIYQLATGQQLGDGIVQFMVEFIRLWLNNEDTESFHIFSYYFFQTYLGAVRDVDVLKMKELPAKVCTRLREHTKKIDIFSKQYLIVPILNEQHWYLAVIHQPGACLIPKTSPVKNGQKSQKTLMILFDSLHSLGSGDRHKFTFSLLQRWLEAEAAHRHSDPEVLQLDASRFARFVPKSPQQQNGVDCGVFMIKSLAHMIQNKPTFSPMTNNRIGKPEMSTMFSNDTVATEGMRLHMLHCYLMIAAIKCQFVYRDDLIPTMIKELGEKPEPLFVFPTETIQIDSSPASKPITKRQSNGDFKDMDKVCAPRISHSKATMNGLSDEIFDKASELQEITNLLRLPTFKPRTPMTSRQLEFFRCSGYTLPSEHAQLRGEVKATVEERRQRYAEGRERQKAMKESSGFVRKTAQEIYEDFIAGRGVVGED